MTSQKKPTKSRSPKPSQGFTDNERAAMKERARELKKPTRPGEKDDGEREVLAKIAELSDADRALAEKLHALVKAVAPTLATTTWYGMPAWARNGKVVCFFQSAQKFKTRYATLGFSDKATLDDGGMWPTAFALTTWSATEEAAIRVLLQRAVR